MPSFGKTLRRWYWTVRALMKRRGPYKGLCSYWDIGDARGAAWGYEDAWTEVRRISGMVSFEPDKIEVELDGRRLRLEPGQSVISHGVDRDLTVEELSG